MRAPTPGALAHARQVSPLSCLAVRASNPQPRKCSPGIAFAVASNVPGSQSSGFASRPAELDEGLVGDLADVDAVDAEGRLPLLGGGGLADVDRCRHVVRSRRAPMPRRSTCRPRGSSTPATDGGPGSPRPSIRSSNSASTQWADVGWYSNRVPGSQLRRHAEKVASRSSHGDPPPRGVHRGAGEPAGVEQHLLDGDHLLAEGWRTRRCWSATRFVEPQRALGQQLPDGRGDHCLRGRSR